MNGRRPRYTALARIVVTADDRDPADVAAEVAAGLGLDPGERRRA